MSRRAVPKANTEACGGGYPMSRRAAPKANTASCPTEAIP